MFWTQEEIAQLPATLRSLRQRPSGAHCIKHSCSNNPEDTCSKRYVEDDYEVVMPWGATTFIVPFCRQFDTLSRVANAMWLISQETGYHLIHAKEANYILTGHAGPSQRDRLGEPAYHNNHTSYYLKREVLRVAVPLARRVGCPVCRKMYRPFSDGSGLATVWARAYYSRIWHAEIPVGQGFNLYADGLGREKATAVRTHCNRVFEAVLPRAVCGKNCAAALLSSWVAAGYPSPFPCGICGKEVPHQATAINTLPHQRVIAVTMAPVAEAKLLLKGHLTTQWKAVYPVCPGTCQKKVSQYVRKTKQEREMARCARQRLTDTRKQLKEASSPSRPPSPPAA